MSRSAVLTAIARLPGRTIPIKGWSLVIERLHAHTGLTEATYRTRHGVTLRLDLGDYTQRQIFYEAFEVDELNFMRRMLRQGDIVLDVGANVGIFTLIAARAVGPTGEVHAFEPVPANHERLIENVALNDLGNVRANRLAVGRESGSVTLGLAEERASGQHMSGFYTVDGPLRQATAPVVTLDRYLSVELPQRQIRLLKMDVEGFEPEALAGLAETLLAGRVDILLTEVSIYHLARHGFTIADQIRPLTTAGYRLHKLGAGGKLQRWTYQGEPTIPQRRADVGLLRTAYMGLQDLRRHFNLIAIAETGS